MRINIDCVRIQDIIDKNPPNPLSTRGGQGLRAANIIIYTANPKAIVYSMVIRKTDTSYDHIDSKIEIGRNTKPVFKSVISKNLI